MPQKVQWGCVAQKKSQGLRSIRLSVTHPNMDHTFSVIAWQIIAIRIVHFRKTWGQPALGQSALGSIPTNVQTWGHSALGHSALGSILIWTWVLGSMNQSLRHIFLALALMTQQPSYVRPSNARVMLVRAWQEPQMIKTTRWQWKPGHQMIKTKQWQWNPLNKMIKIKRRLWNQ